MGDDPKTEADGPKAAGDGPKTKLEVNMAEKQFDDVQDQEFEDEQFEDGDGEEHESQDEGKEEQDEQSKIDKLLEARLIRERKNTQKMLKDIFGTADLKTAAQYYQAGQAVAKASGKSPQEVMQRLAQQYQQQQGSNPQGGDRVSQEIQEIKDILAVQRETDVRAKEEASARKEFGTLYSEHEDDIRDMADDRGLSLVDAAAIILRPHLSDLYSKRAKAKQGGLRKKKVEGSEESPARKGVDPATKLNASQKRVAQQMRMSYAEYYQQLKELGKID